MPSTYRACVHCCTWCAAESARTKSRTLTLADSFRAGHLREVKDTTLDRLTGHALRHADTSFASEVVPITELKWLLNHRINDATLGYMQRWIDRPRPREGLSVE